ncbi:nuclear transport factor 2 family protein [Sphingopyxis sp. OPL5]|uniref:nuclear transport factor 2 family protein n=1 Tax=Sphingopyxis sp. OPL5 TaxID=2486273 RepID=UPI00164DF3F3|nr:nuclear transport factor 2 family protein [Sphingopyxis sp. OPL5]QNO27936.1 nuclear transport factor 2 family protein [Sphingopyxis sp. OPL5]
MAGDTEARLRRIEDRFAIADLEADYAALWDFGDAEGWSRLYVEDGRFEIVEAGAMPAVKLVGRSELQAFCADISKQWTGLHFMHPPRVDIGDGDATSLIFFEFRHLRTGGDGHVRQGLVGGFYRTCYVRTMEGWRISSRVEHPVFENGSNSYNFR